MTHVLPFIARPHYSLSGANMLSERASWSKQSAEIMDAVTGQWVSSVLPDGFNQLMCMALNDPLHPTHFVMLHADIVPQENWVKLLLDEIEASGVDILSAVVPLKNRESDETSTAVGVLNGKRSRFRRLTMNEVRIQPPTFFTADVCCGDERLLINTGLMAIDLRKPWIEPWMDNGGFRLETYSWREPSGERKATVLTEDWLLSWDAQVKFGACVAATTKVKLVHYGEVGFPNY